MNRKTTCYRRVAASLRVACLGGALGLLLLMAAPGAGRAATLYVDPQLGADRADYDAATRSCGSGTEAAYVVLADGVAAAQAGDGVRLREGDYTDQLVVGVWGAPGAEIVIGAYEASHPALFVGNLNVGPHRRQT